MKSASTTLANDTVVWHKGARSRLYNSTGFFYLAWASHYFPFYLMGRQLFLHHYLPAHLAASLVAGALVEFIFSVDPDIPSEEPGSVPPTPKTKQSSKTKQDVGRIRVIADHGALLTWAAVAGVLSVVIGTWWYFLPLTYGKPGLSVEQVNARKWLGYDLHFAK